MTNARLDAFQCPAFLRNLPDPHIWLLWGSPKSPDTPKQPYYASGAPRRGNNLSQTDKNQLVDFDTAKEAALQLGFLGIGVAMTSQFTIIDIDAQKGIDPATGKLIKRDLSPEVRGLAKGSYAEYSFSGKGIHIFTSSNITGESGRAHREATLDNWGLELFYAKKFVALTGHLLEESLSDIAPLTSELYLAISSIQKEKTTPILNLATPPIPSYKSPLPLDLIHYCLKHIDPSSHDTWLDVSMILKYELGDDGFEIFDEWSDPNNSNYNAERNKLRWDSFKESNQVDNGMAITGATLIAIAKSASLRNALPWAPPKVTAEGDFTPLVEEAGEENEEAPPKPKTLLSNQFNIRPVADFVKHAKPLSWFIKGVLPKAGLGVLYGESGSGKSFLAIDMCAAMVQRQLWNGIKTTSGACRILYVVAEGANGFANRILAYCAEKAIRPHDLTIDVISEVAPNLMNQKSVDTLITEINQHGPYELIVMDTFSQVTPGANENSGEDMGKALGYCRKITGSTGAMILLVAHAGKNSSKGVRGWSGLHAAADVVLGVTRGADDVRSVKVIKSKDDLDGKEYGFALEPITIGSDEDGVPISSCFVKYCEVFKKPVLKANQQLIYDVMDEFEEGAWVSIQHVIDSCISDEELTPRDRKQRIANLKRSLETCIGKFLEENPTTDEVRML